VSSTATLLDPNDAMSFTSITDTTTVNGKSFFEVFAKAPRTITRTTLAGRQVTTTLDNKGRIVQIAVPGVLPVQLAYDAHGRLETATQGTRTFTRAYGVDGYLASVTDPLGQTQGFTPDAVGRVLAETRPDGQEVLFAYAAGNQISVTPPGQPSHLFGYSPVDLQASYDPPALPAGPTPTSWSYDLDRKLTLITKAGGVDVSFGYDDAGMQTSVSFPGGSITRSYHPTTGKLITLAGPAGVTVDYGYDGHLLTDVTWSGGISGTVHRTYNNDLQVIGETVNGGGAVSFGRDNDGLLTSAGALTLSRDPQNGRVTGASVGIVTDIMGYDAFGAPEQRVTIVNGAPLLSVTYARDALNRISERTETIDGETHTDGYTYDLAGRLTDVHRDGVLATHYEYDENGNRLSRTTASESLAGTYDDQDRLLSYGGVNYAYKDSGELLSRTDCWRRCVEAENCWGVKG
jgi:YD repeat-containing protein